MAGPWRATITGALSHERSAAPAIAGLHTQGVDQVEVGGEGAYLPAVGSAGALARLRVHRLRRQGDVFAERALGVEGELLSHWPAGPAAWARLGAGGALIQSRVERDAGDDSVADDAAVHAAAEGRLELGPMELDGRARLQGRRGQGTFEGWYPAWECAVGGSAELWGQAARLRADATLAGHRVDGARRQRRRVLGAGARLEVRPWEGVSGHLEARQDWSSQSDFDPSTFGNRQLGASLAVELSKLPTWQVSVDGYHYTGRWTGPDSATRWAGSGVAGRTAVAF